jgi:formylglycine-generating enzyme required for sulfatase activity
LAAVERECLSEATVIEFVDGVCSPAERSVVEAHLASCSECTELVTEAAAALREGTRPLGPIGVAPTNRLPAGSRVGRYQILDRVGRGGMGEVYAAYHPDLDRRIALKVVRESGAAAPDRQARLLREARTIARLSHPNVVAVYDAGTVADRVYVAMEFVEGMTIDRWLAAARRSWREILRVFVAAARGLAAAHAAGLVHRDFKPQNVMIARDGAVRVMDFGLARLTAVESASSAPAVTTPPLSDGQPGAALSTVTQAGTVVGTPAYMSPEQFRGDPANARSDQFSFCVALYEALYGVRPFRGTNLLSLTMSVTEGELRPAEDAAKHGVPAWLRRALTRGLRLDPAARYPSMQALIDRLEDDPAVRRRRRLGTGAVVAVVVATMLVAWQITSRRRTAAEREIARHVDEATRATTEARKTASEARTLRQDAFAAFDRPDRRNGELLWRQVRTRLPRADASYDRAERSLETAFTLDSSRERHRNELADLRLEHLLFAEDFRLGSKSILLEERLAAVDPDGGRRRALAAPGTLELRTRPSASRILLERYEHDPATGRRTARSMGPFDASRATTSLAPGSYRLLLNGPGLAPVVYPFEIRRGDRTVADLVVPLAAAVPKGFVYVPAGTFWFGDADEQLRTQFLGAVPIHQRRTEAYLIARNETTFQDWITFLDQLPAGERARRTPAVTGTPFRGALFLRRRADGWRIGLQPAARRYEAKQHEPIIYADRSRRTRQDWLRFPIGGITLDDTARYLAWLREGGRLPGARLCSEVEWERAARGADDRLFPHGDELAADDANIDITYERMDGAYGPDEIGAHPESRSPFEVDDLAGNIVEIVRSEVPGAFAIRGGGYYFAAASARSSNREQIPSSVRDVNIGVRVCADAAFK